MLPHRVTDRRARRTRRSLGIALLALLVMAVGVVTPRPVGAQMPQAAQVVASVTRWMAYWLGQYILGRGIDLARERVRGAGYRRQLVDLERTLRRRMSDEPSQRSRTARELRLVQRQIRMIDGVSNPSFDRDSARAYFRRVNDDVGELREVVQAVSSGMEAAWAELDEMRREIEALRESVDEMRRGGRVARDDDGEVRFQGESDGAGPGLPLPRGVRLGVGYAAALSDFTVPAYSGAGAAAVSRRQQGASVRIGLDGGFLQFGVSAAALGAWLDSTGRRDDITDDPADRQPLQTVSVGADLSIALARRSLIRPLIGGAVEQVWFSFRNLPGATAPEVVFSGLAYGPQAGLDLRIGDSFTLTLLGRMMTGKLTAPSEQLPGMPAATMPKLRRNQLTAVISYSEP